MFLTSVLEVIKMRTAKWAVRRLHIQPSVERIAFDVGDLRDAIIRVEWDRIRLKMSDLMLTWWCMVYRFTRISFPIIGGCRAAKSIIHQIRAWKRISRAGFGVDIPASELGRYLECWSDVQKPHAVQRFMWKIADERIDLGLTVDAMNRALVAARTQPYLLFTSTRPRRRF